MRPLLVDLFLSVAIIAAFFFAVPQDIVASPATLDPTSEELIRMGANGEAIQQARAEVLALLSQSNSCSGWFLSAEPDVVEKFRSLRFVVDEKSSGDIRKLENSPDGSGYYQPYVALTGQNVGWGSSITLNAHGAFFKKDAPVLLISRSDELGHYVSFRNLEVGDYPGATLPARILTMLHELGHVVNLLPLDARVPSGPLLSVRNTEEVLRHCGTQIRAHKKLSKIFTANAGSPSSAGWPQEAIAPRPVRRGRFSQ